jgi:hypothetical protein
MRDCANARMKDLLPDLLHDRLPAAVRAEVRAHVDACADCRLELELLRRVRAAVIVPRVDAQRIAAVIPPYRVRPLWRRSVMESPRLQLAAAILLLVGGATVLTLVGRGPASDRTAVQPPGIDAPPVAALPTAPATIGESSGAGRGSVTAPVELAVGETFSDLNESELRALLDELGRFEAVTPSEAEVVLPALGRSGS